MFFQIIEIVEFISTVSTYMFQQLSENGINGIFNETSNNVEIQFGANDRNGIKEDTSLSSTACLEDSLLVEVIKSPILEQDPMLLLLQKRRTVAFTRWLQCLSEPYLPTYKQLRWSMILLLHVILHRRTRVAGLKAYAINRLKSRTTAGETVLLHLPQGSPTWCPRAPGRTK